MSRKSKSKKDMGKVERTTEAKGSIVVPEGPGDCRTCFVTTIQHPAAVGIRLIRGKAIVTANRRTEVVSVDTTKELIIAISEGNKIQGVVTREEAAEEDADKGDNRAVGSLVEVEGMAVEDAF